MRRDSNLNLSFIIAMISIFACFVISWRMILPQYQSNKASVTRLDEEVVAANDKLETLQATKKTLQSSRTLVNQVFAAVPADKDLANLMAELDAIAAKYSVTIPGVQVSDSGSANSRASLSANRNSITFTADGSFVNITSFMSALESDVKIMRIKSVAISTTDSGLSAILELSGFQRQNQGVISTTSGGSQ